MVNLRVGQGSDIHPIDNTRELVLGSLTFPDHAGLSGHSDGDCVVHAMIDALLGAAGLGDIGNHFPDSDPFWKDANSVVLLCKVMALLTTKNMTVMNMDITIHCVEPKITPRKTEMTIALAKHLDIDTSQLNIKAKTDNGIGPAATGQAIATEAIVLLHVA